MMGGGSTQEAEAHWSLCVQGQPDLHNSSKTARANREILSWKENWQKEDKQMAKKHLKKCSVPGIVGEIQVKMKKIVGKTGEQI